MKPGFYLTCGMHWMHVTPGFGCEWVTCGVPETATRYETREEAEQWKARLSSRLYAPPYTVVEVAEVVDAAA